jgi:hypothetical protein
METSYRRLNTRAIMKIVFQVLGTLDTENQVMVLTLIPVIWSSQVFAFIYLFISSYSHATVRLWRRLH